MGRILLCDDEDSLCRSLGRILRSAGHEVVAVDGPAGYARLRQERFDLILTDIRMPGVNGFEILAAARTPRAGHAGDRHERQRRDPRRGQGDARRRARLPDQAVRDQGARGGGRQRPQAGDARDTDRRSDRLARPERALDAGQRSRDAAGVQPAVAGRRHPLHGAHHRRVGHRQGAGGALAARRLGARVEAVRRRELRRDPAVAGRVGAVRPHQGRLHRRDHVARGALRAGRSRHDLSRRDRRDGAGRPGQAAAPDPGRRALPGGRGDRAEDRRAHPGGDQPQPRARGGGVALPRRPLLAPQRHPDRDAEPARAADRHHAAGRALSRPAPTSATAARSPASTRRRWPRCAATPGRATSASSRT